jgi:defect in organelle trafficking protein DotC
MDTINLQYLENIYESRPRQEESLSADKATANEVLNVVKTARNQAVYDTAFSLGIKAGMQQQINAIYLIIDKNVNHLNKIYNFEPYLIYNRVVPPVITEARNLYNQDGEDAVRLSGALYKIERKARITSVAPNWREYLSFPRNGSVITNNIAIKPRNSNEIDLWKKGVRNGYNEGVEQSNILLKQALERLNRDYIGILRFHRFLVEGKVTLPVLAQSHMEMNKNGSSLILNEELLRLTVQSDFAEQEKWQAKIIGHAKQTKNYTIIQEVVKTQNIPKVKNAYENER